MSEPKISLYTRIIRFFLRDLYNRTDTLLANSRQLSESIDNLSAENRGFSKSIDNAEKNISELNEKAVRNSQIAESNMNEFNSYRNQLDERLRSDDITTIELSHRIEILESSIKNDFELFNKRTYSQSGEDSIIMYIMAMKGIPLSECSYLDLGANHPKVMSNTYFFYEQGARGVLVEANPKLADELGNERSGDIVLNKCISGKSGEKLDFNILNLDGLSKVGDVSDILIENPDARIEKNCSA